MKETGLPSLPVLVPQRCACGKGRGMGTGRGILGGGRVREVVARGKQSAGDDSFRLCCMKAVRGRVYAGTTTLGSTRCTRCVWQIRTSIRDEFGPVHRTFDGSAVTPAHVEPGPDANACGVSLRNAWRAAAEIRHGSQSKPFTERERGERLTSFSSPVR